MAKRKVTKEIENEICLDRDNGMSYRELAEKYDLHQWMISKVLEEGGLIGFDWSRDDSYQVKEQEINEDQEYMAAQEAFRNTDFELRHSDNEQRVRKARQKVAANIPKKRRLVRR